MRPLRVEMAGFSAFRERTTVDFTDVDLVALWGPTGSGKSTVVDAVTFALYGSVSRYDDNRLVAPIINQLSSEARVCLDFEVGEKEYRAVRVVRRTEKGATTKEARLESGADMLAGSAREMEPAVEQLLGMDFEQFTKTVVLPQGEFSAFLHDRPAERQKLLRQLLDLGIYVRIGEEARRRATAAQAKVDALNEHLAAGEDVTDEQLAAMDARAKELAELRVKLAGETATLNELVAEVKELREAGSRMERDLDRLAQLGVPDAVVSLGTELKEAAQVLADATARTKAARTRQVEAEEAAQAGPDAALCRRLLEAHAERAALAKTIEAREAALSVAAEALDKAQAGAEAARSVFAAAESDLEAARVAAGAAGLRAILVAGAPCPVCEQIVTNVPDHDLDQELKTSEERRTQALAALQDQDGARAKAHEEHANARATLDSARQQDRALDSKLEGAAPVETLEADLEKADLLARAKSDAVTEAAEALRLEEVARSELETLRGSERDLRRSFGAARDSVASLQPPPAAGDSLHVDWTELAGWASEKALAVEDSRAANAQTLETKTELCDSKQQEIAALCDPYLADGMPDNPAEYFAEEATRAATDLETARKRRQQLDDMRAKVGDLQAEERVAAELGRLLRASGFERWLMEEAVADLVDRASDRLLELSNRQFSMIADETEIRIQDHLNADEVRDARTLSGGETFLASLALALALADSITELAPRGSPRLDSIFLDEGFGTLDPETLDVVAAAIEELGAAGRMVAIVTHIRELADRMPVRFEVIKGATSSSVERVEV